MKRMTVVAILSGALVFVIGSLFDITWLAAAGALLIVGFASLWVYRRIWGPQSPVWDIVDGGNPPNKR